MSKTIRDFERQSDAAKEVLDDLLYQIDKMAEAMSRIFDLAYDADEDNWKDKCDEIQNIAGSLQC